MLNTEDLEPLPLGQSKQSEYNTSQKNGARTNLIYDMNHSVSPYDASDVSRNANESISAASSTQTVPRIINPCLPKKTVQSQFHRSQQVVIRSSIQR